MRFILKKIINLFSFVKYTNLYVVDTGRTDGRGYGSC